MIYIFCNIVIRHLWSDLFLHVPYTFPVPPLGTWDGFPRNPSEGVPPLCTRLTLRTPSKTVHLFSPSSTGRLPSRIWFYVSGLPRISYTPRRTPLIPPVYHSFLPDSFTESTPTVLGSVPPRTPVTRLPKVGRPLSFGNCLKSSCRSIGLKQIFLVRSNLLQWSNLLFNLPTTFSPS